MLVQHHRPRQRRPRSRLFSSSDRVFLATTLAGLALFALSWATFHRHFLSGPSKHYSEPSQDGHSHSSASDASSRKDRGSRLGQRGRSSGDGGSGGTLHGQESSNGALLERATLYTPDLTVGADGAFCESHFGMSWVQSWNATRREVCRPGEGLLGSGGSGAREAAAPPPSVIACRSADPDEHLPPASAPHLLCDATNLWLDPSKLSRVRCPRHRPRYLCISRTYHAYSEGAWAAACEWPGFQLADFSKDHMQDIFGGLAYGAQGLQVPKDAAVEELPTLMVTREINEHANVFHTLTDLLNVYITLLIMGWEQAPRQVLILDAHRPASLDLFWPVVAAGGGAEALVQGGDPWTMQQGGRPLVRRVEDIKELIMFRHAAFVPPGYTSLLFAHLYEGSSCRQPTQLLRGFRQFVLTPFGLGGRAPRDNRGSSGALTVRLVSRRPSKKRARMARQLANEGEILAMLEQVADSFEGGGSSGVAAGAGARVAVEVSLLDLSGLSLAQQLEAVVGTDVLVAMHGAALAWALFMQPHTAVVELWPGGGIWRCYENFSLWAGLLYRRVVNSDPALHQETARGDKTTIDVGVLKRVLEELLPLITASYTPDRLFESYTMVFKSVMKTCSSCIPRPVRDDSQGELARASPSQLVEEHAHLKAMQAESSELARISMLISHHSRPLQPAA